MRVDEIGQQRVSVSQRRLTQRVQCAEVWSRSEGFQELERRGLTLERTWTPDGDIDDQLCLFILITTGQTASKASDLSTPLFDMLDLTQLRFLVIRQSCRSHAHSSAPVLDFGGD